MGVSASNMYLISWYSSAEDMTSPNAKEGMQPAGSNSILPKEHGSMFYMLPVVKNSDKDVTNLCIYYLCFVKSDFFLWTVRLIYSLWVTVRLVSLEA